jgi:hypothetical protein
MNGGGNPLAKSFEDGDDVFGLCIVGDARGRRRRREEPKITDARQPRVSYSRTLMGTRL